MYKKYFEVMNMIATSQGAVFTLVMQELMELQMAEPNVNHWHKDTFARTLTSRNIVKQLPPSTVYAIAEALDSWDSVATLLTIYGEISANEDAIPTEGWDGYAFIARALHSGLFLPVLGKIDGKLVDRNIDKIVRLIARSEDLQQLNMVILCELD